MSLDICKRQYVLSNVPFLVQINVSSREEGIKSSKWPGISVYYKTDLQFDAEDGRSDLGKGVDFGLKSQPTVAP